MKKILLFVILSLFATIVRAQNLYEIVSHNGNTVETIDISLIDSITYSKSDNSYSQNIWKNGEKSTASISINDYIDFNERYEYYPFLSDEIKTGIVTNKGNYCFISNALEDCDSCHLIVVSDESRENNLIAFADSLGLIRYININDNKFTIIYGKNEFLIFLNETIFKRGSYDDLPIESYYTSPDERKNVNVIKRTCAVLCSMLDFISDVDSNVLRNFSYELNNGRFVIDNTDEQKHEFAMSKKVRFRGPSVIDYLEFLHDYFEQLQKLARYIVFGNISLETLYPKRNKINNYDLGCKVSYSSNGMLGDVFLRDPNISIILKNRSTDKVVRTETRTSTSSTDNSYYMNFDNLDLDTRYSYYPKVDAYFWMPDRPERLSVWEIGIEYSFPPFLFLSMGASIEGESEQFDVGHPGSTIGEAYDVKDKSAKVDCQFSDLPDGATCYVNVYGDSGIRRESCSATEDKQFISLSGLKPCNLYICQPVVEYNGNKYESDKSINFTTNPPDISGTWSCKETHYDKAGNPKYTTYSVTLNENGSVQLSNYDNLVSGGWGISCDGSVNINVITLATQSFVGQLIWKGKIDNLENPTKITGVTHGENWNTVIGSVSVGGYAFEMTR